MVYFPTFTTFKLLLEKLKSLMKRILLSILSLVIGIVSSYGQCSATTYSGGTGNGGATTNGAYDDMTPVTAATDTTVMKGYFGVNWYPTPDSVQSSTDQGSQYYSYEIYQLNRVQVAGDWKMKVTATNADSNFSTFGIGFPQNSPRDADGNYGLDLSGNAQMSIDVDNSAQPTTPLYFTANITDVYGTRVEYFADTNYNNSYNYFFNAYDNWYKRKFTDTISASSSTVVASYGATKPAWPAQGQSPWSTASSTTTVTFDFGGGWNVWIGRGVSTYTPGVTTPTKTDSFPCSNVVTGTDYAWYCPSIEHTFDFTQVTSMSFYFNGGGVWHYANGNPTTTSAASTGIAYPVFTGVVYLDNFSIGTNTGCCWNYAGCQVTGTTNPVVNMVQKAMLVPNPASGGQAMINDPSASSYSITVTNTLGAVILTTTGTSFNVPEASGMYFVTYTNGLGAPTTLPLVVSGR